MTLVAIDIYFPFYLELRDIKDVSQMTIFLFFFFLIDFLFVFRTFNVHLPIPFLLILFLHEKNFFFIHAIK
jgi:hypothetical protein